MVSLASPSTPSPIYKIATFGCGSFGTALSFKAALNGHDVRILCRRPAAVEEINVRRRNDKYLQAANYQLPPNVTASCDAAECLKDVQFIIHTIPVQSSEDFLRAHKELIRPDVVLISASKGLNSQTLEYMSQLVPRVLENPSQPLAVLSGPSFAKELVENQPSAVVAASADEKVAEQVQQIFLHRHLRVYTTTDVVGVEVGGALKNIFAIGCGVCEGLGLGYNPSAALVTRGCAEMMRLAVAMGGAPHTLSGLSGIGDLLLTCFGSLSRNRTVGKRLGEGESLEAILASMTEVAEGVATTPAALKLAEMQGLDLPIIRAVNKILTGELTPRAALEMLMAMPVSAELPAEICGSGFTGRE